MRSLTRAIAAALLVVSQLAARSYAQQANPGTSAPLATGTVIVFAAASLTGAFQAIASAFEKSHPTTKVQLNFAGSPTLVRQIQEGAPADLFASADEANMQKLIEHGDITGAPQLFARNTLQMVVQAGNPKHIAALVDLTKPGLTLALCGPTVPCGHYAAEAFGKAGLTTPAASQELDVKAVITKVAMGEADAGIVYVTDVRAAGRAVVGVNIPEPFNIVARYPIAAMKGAPNAGAGAEFLAFVLSPEGQQILATFGFLPG